MPKSKKYVDTNWIQAYYGALTSGAALAGQYVLKIYKRLLDGISSETYIFDAQKANRAITFIETFCRHCEGRNDLLILELWQKALISAIFGIVEKDGRRVFREVFIVVGRKNGKTLLAAAITAYMAFADGEYGAKIYCLAPKMDQSRILFDNFRQMIEKDSDMSSMAKKRRLDMYIESTNSAIMPLAFNARKSDGFNPQLVINDELSSWPANLGLLQMEVMKSALGARRQPLILSISTAGYINDGAYDVLWTRGVSIINGDSEERRYLPIFYTIDDVTQWDSIEEIKKANPNIGVSIWPDFFQEEIAVAHRSLSKKVEFLTKYCNVKQSMSVQWLDYKTVDSSGITGITLEDFRDSYAVAGIDLSSTTDLTAAAILIEKYGLIYAFCKFFMPPERIEDMTIRDNVPYDIFVQQGLIYPSGENAVNYSDVVDYITHVCTEYDITLLKIGYDKWSSQYLVEDLKNRGFATDDVRQGDNLMPVILEFEALLKDHKLKVVDNALLKSHFLNVALKSSVETRKFKPIKLDKKSHIDGFIAVNCALCMRQKYNAEIGVLLENERLNGGDK